jgi:hypothetical protein
MSEYMLVLKYIREMLAMAQYEQAQDCSNYECTTDELGLSKLLNGASNLQLFCISFLLLLFSFLITIFSYFLFFYMAIICNALKNL